MQSNVGMGFQEIGDLLGLVRRQVIQEDVDLLPQRAQLNDSTQEINELVAGVAGRSLAVHLSGTHVQGRVQRERSVTLVLKPMPLDSSRRKRQHGI